MKRARRVSSDEDESCESLLLNEEDRPRILIKKARPKLLGINVTLILPVIYLVMLIILILHLALIISVSARIRGGYVVTLMFDLLGPVAIFYWLFALLYVFFGARVLFFNEADYWIAARRFRLWVQVTRLMIVGQTVALLHLIFGCVMFVNSISIEFHIDSYIKRNRYTGIRKAALERVAEVHDVLFRSQSNMSHRFPLNVLSNIGADWGLLGTIIAGFPFLFCLAGIFAQEAYYKWRYAHTGKSLD